jgi:microcompartment protein CcmK/EutM
VPALAGARWLIVSPFGREELRAAATQGQTVSREPSPIVYDDLGAGLGQTIGYEEGAEAAQPFDEPTPIDALSAALVDEIFYNPSLTP